MIEHWLQTRLADCADLAAVNDGRVWPNVVPQLDAQGSQLPATTYALARLVDSEVMNGTEGWRTAFFQVAHWSAAYDDTLAMAKATGDTLRALSVRENGFVVDHVSVMNAYDDPRQSPDGSEGPLFRRVQEVRIEFWEPPIPANRNSLEGE